MGGVKMIYIDPPYNTGKDFIYKDNYKDNLRNYQEVTQQTDSQGNQLSTNAESEGRFHSNWLNMMYPRLILARNLLTEDGVIFISIDDNELENIKKIGNEIFGEENLINSFIWISNIKGRQISRFGAATTKEYIISYAKDIQNLDKFLIDSKFATELMPDSYKGFSYEIKKDKKGMYITTNELYNSNSSFNETTRPNLVFDIFYNPKSRKVLTSRCSSELNTDYITIKPKPIPKSENKFYAWRWSKQKVMNESDELEFIEKEGNWKIYTKRRNFNKTSLKDVITNISTDKGSNTMKALDLNYFDYCKPVELIEIIVSIINDKYITVLDFFAGSSTTAHAVLNLNMKDGGERKFIQVQLPEPINPKKEAYKAGFNNIAEIGKERIRRVIKKIKQEEPKRSKDMDLGFKVFKLDSSNIKSWDGDSDNLKQSLLDSVENIKEDRSQEDVLYEILLKHGLDLSLPIEERIIEKTKVFNVGHGTLILCLDDKITSKVAEGIGNWKKECKPAKCTVIFKDSGFTDVEKTNSIQILKRFGIKNIKSL